MRNLAIFSIALFSLTTLFPVSSEAAGTRGKLCLNNDDGKLIIRKRCRKKTETELDLAALQASITAEVEAGPSGITSTISRRKSFTCDGAILGRICSEEVSCCEKDEMILGGGVSISASSGDVKESKPMGNCWAATVITGISDARFAVYAVCGS